MKILHTIFGQIGLVLRCYLKLWLVNLQVTIRIFFICWIFMYFSERKHYVKVFIILPEILSGNELPGLSDISGYSHDLRVVEQWVQVIFQVV